jgi:hypothetical protein
LVSPAAQSVPVAPAPVSSAVSTAVISGHPNLPAPPPPFEAPRPQYEAPRAPFEVPRPPTSHPVIQHILPPTTQTIARSSSAAKSGGVPTWVWVVLVLVVGFTVGGGLAFAFAMR